MVEKILHHVKRRFYDSHPNLPLDPDSDRYKVTRPVHTDPWHIGVVAFGAFFGTLARYQAGAWLPAKDSSWPFAVFFVNLAGAFLLGWLLQVLANHGKDQGGRRMLRLLFGTGFLGAFTTYSTLAVGSVALMLHNQVAMAVTYAVTSVIGGIIAAAAGVYIAGRQKAKV